jgi:hypothetical protein
MDAKVEFSISGNGAVGVCAVGLKGKVDEVTGSVVVFTVVYEDAVGAGEGVNEGTGLAGDEIAGTLKAGALNGSGSLGMGRDISTSEVSAAGGGVTDRVRLGAGDSSMSSSTSLASRSGEED